MTIASQTFALTQGDDAAVIVPVEDAAGARLSLAGAAIRWLHRVRGETAFVVKQAGAGVSVVQEAEGDAVRVDFTSAETAALKPGRPYDFELEVTIGGKVSTVARGAFSVAADIR